MLKFLQSKYLIEILQSHWVHSGEKKWNWDSFTCFHAVIHSWVKEECDLLQYIKLFVCFLVSKKDRNVWLLAIKVQEQSKTNTISLTSLGYIWAWL